MREQHTTRVAGWPNPNSVRITLAAALRLVRAYGDRLPTPEKVMHDFGVSRATAYRWIAALRAAA